jgi:hypothetical protein
MFLLADSECFPRRDFATDVVKPGFIKVRNCLITAEADPGSFRLVSHFSDMSKLSGQLVLLLFS